MRAWQRSSFLLLGFCLLLRTNVVHSSVNGGIGCAACHVVVALVEQMMEINNNTVVETLDKLCSYMPPKFQPPCLRAFEVLGPALTELISEKAGPDVACHALNLCYTQPGHPTCTTINPHSYDTKIPFEMSVLKARAAINNVFPAEHALKGGICDIPGIKEICDMIKKIMSSHEPVFDEDKDGFSPSFSLRGAAWRGKDCSDLLADVHPGAIPHNQDKLFDSNCNGIFGINNKTNAPYEEELCGSSKPRGLAVIGDSMSAHFHLPPQWLDATQISKEAFKHVGIILENEIDWPMMSAATGYGKDEWPEVILGPIDSLYLRLRKQNHCNHRDYQNIAVNGEDSFSLAKNLVQTLSRNKLKDQPLVVLHGLVGNDVCNGQPDTVANMTTPEEMFNNTMKTLTYLDEHLPANSHVVLIGLADGRVLYNNMGHRIHPVATHWGKLTYSIFYDFLNCLQISPCTGYMTSNETLRNITAARAALLSDVLHNISLTQSFSSFKLHFLADPFPQAIKKWILKGGEAWQLIEPSDGFHGNQYGQALIAQVIWETLLPTGIFGPINPLNDKIKNLFGDQGGY